MTEWWSSDPVAEPEHIEAAPPLNGEAYLLTIPDQGKRNLIRQVASGESDIGKVTSFKEKGVLARDVANYDPTWSTMVAPARAATYKNFMGTGVEARNFQSNDMAIKHIGDGLNNIEAMRNSTVPLYNALTAPISRQFDPKYQEARANLGVDIDAIGSELMRSFRGSGSASEKEAAEWRDKFPLNGSPVEQRAALSRAAYLLAGRVTAAGHRWNDAMGPHHQRDPISWLSPEGQEVIRNAQELDPQKPVPPGMFKPHVLGRKESGAPPPTSATPRIIRYDAEGNRIP